MSRKIHRQGNLIAQKKLKPQRQTKPGRAQFTQFRLLKEMFWRRMAARQFFPLFFLIEITNQ